MTPITQQIEKIKGYGYPLWIPLLSILIVTVFIIVLFITNNVSKLEQHEIEEAKTASNKIFAALAVTTLEPVITEDVAGLETIIEQILLQVTEIQSITVKNEEGVPLVHRQKEQQKETKELASFLKKITFEGEVFGEMTIAWDTAEKIAEIKKQAIHQWSIASIPLLFLTIIFGISLHFLLLKPLSKINERILAINKGNLTLISNFAGSREIQLLQITVNNLCHSQRTEQQQRKELIIAKQKADDELHRRKQTEVEREKLQTELHRAQKMEAIGLLAGRVAHDLNNVLSGIVSYPELLALQLPPDSPHLKTVHVIKKSGEKAAAIVQDLLTLARRGITSTEPISMNDIITQYLVSPEYEMLISLHPGTRVITRFDDSLSNIRGSGMHLSKTIMNLIINATEAMPNGGDIIISTENTYLDTPVQGYDHVQEGDYVTLTITDSGVGIPSENKKKIFEPFFSTKELGRSGTGLGMVVVWGTVKDHRGYIDIHSKENVGTTFILNFPITPQTLADQTEHKSMTSYKGNGETILIVDDIEIQRTIATDILCELGYKTVAVSSGESAVSYVKNNSIDMVLLDMIMDPGIDGFETLKQMKRIIPSLKAILASGYSEIERIKEIEQLGVSQHIKKPYSLEKIGLAIKRELAKALS